MSTDTLVTRLRGGLGVGLKMRNDAADRIEALEAELESAREDARRLDWIEAQWRDGIHVECCATGGPTVHGLRPSVTVYFGDRTVEGLDIRDALDAAKRVA